MSLSPSRVAIVLAPGLFAALRDQLVNDAHVGGEVLQHASCSRGRGRLWHQPQIAILLADRQPVTGFEADAAPRRCGDDDPALAADCYGRVLAACHKAKYGTE